MTERADTVRVAVARDAGYLAFKIGQAVEWTLLQRARKLAADEADASQAALVTVDHVKSALDESLITDISSQIPAILNDGPPSRRRAVFGAA